MKLLSFEVDGESRFGAVVDNDTKIIDLGQALQGKYNDLQSLLAADALQEAEEKINSVEPHYTLDEVRYLPVIPNPGKIWCCGLNYGEHVRETQREVNELPTFFLRVADSQVGHNEAILCPRESSKLDFEAELAVIIGKPGRRIEEQNAWDHIAGYACYNDGSVRDWQRHSQQWCPGKNFYRTGGFGPWMVTADEIPANTLMQVTSRLNGEIMQQATTDLMIHSIQRQITYTSAIAPLQPGDVIVTGTPGGVGARREPPVWMKPGDIIEIEVDKVGILRNQIEAD